MIPVLENSNINTKLKKIPDTIKGATSIVAHSGSMFSIDKKDGVLIFKKQELECVHCGFKNWNDDFLCNHCHIVLPKHTDLARVQSYVPRLGASADKLVLKRGIEPWLTDWEKLKKFVTEQAKTLYGPLRGYYGKIKDFEDDEQTSKYADWNGKYGEPGNNPRFEIKFERPYKFSNAIFHITRGSARVIGVKTQYVLEMVIVPLPASSGGFCDFINPL